MGCDIHIAIEKFDPKHGWFFVGEGAGYGCNRDYELFANLASVRGDSHNVARGLPADVSPGTLEHAVGPDWHSHSCMSLIEALPFFKASVLRDPKKSYFEKMSMQESFTKIFEFYGIPDGKFNPTDYRIVFWFDN